MNGTFTYSNPTKLHFGPNALDNLAEELQNYGPSVLLVYGKQSIKKNGLYDKIIAILQAAGKTITEDPGVMPNPTVEKLAEGVARPVPARQISYWQWAEVLCVTTPKEWPWPLTARKMRGKSIMCVWSH